jgi:hypothetical protein
MIYLCGRIRISQSIVNLYSAYSGSLNARPKHYAPVPCTQSKNPSVPKLTLDFS